MKSVLCAQPAYAPNRATKAASTAAITYAQQSGLFKGQRVDFQLCFELLSFLRTTSNNIPYYLSGSDKGMIADHVRPGHGNKRV